MEFSRPLFAGQVHTAFQVQHPSGQAVELHLDEVAEGGASETFEQFSLKFRGPANLPFAQGMHSFSHPALGPFELFIVPVGRDAEAMYYEAAFSLFKGPTSKLSEER